MRKLRELLDLKQYYEEQMKGLNKSIRKLQEKNEEERRVWRSDCLAAGVEFGTPNEEYPAPMKKKLDAIRNRFRMLADPLEARRERLYRKYLGVIRELDTIPINKSAGKRRKRPVSKVEWAKTLSELAEFAVAEYVKNKYPTKKVACTAMTEEYSYKGKPINWESLYRYMKGKTMGTNGE